MRMKLYLYWRWMRRSRVRLRRVVMVALPRVIRGSERAVGDNFPVLTTRTV